MTDEEKVKREYPDAQICWTSRGWRIFVGDPTPGPRIKELGRTDEAHVSPTEAWADAASKLDGAL